VRQFSLVQLQALRVGCPLTRLTVNDENAWDLRQLCEDDLVLVFNSSDNSISKQVAVPFVFLSDC